MSLLHRLFPFLAPAEAVVQPRRPTLLVEFLADRGRLEDELAALRAEAASADARDRANWAELAERLAAMSTALQDAVAAATTIQGDVSQAQATLATQLEGVAREVGKLGREQFRATTLLEGNGAALEELAGAWREHLSQREREAADLRQVLAELESQVRLGYARDLLPVADALDQSVRSARALARELPVRAGPEAGTQQKARPGPSLLARLLGAPREAPAPASPSPAIESWLQGLLLVERRLLALLERDGVRPMPTVGHPFDPHRHLAVAVARDGRVPDGTIVGEELRGYTIGDQVLRHAEVVVARTELVERGRESQGDAEQES